jgi:hypothetical protein
MRDAVYAVHATRPDDIGAVEIVFRTEREAVAYARDRSTDWRVRATCVTRFTIGELGTWHPIAWFAEGQEQSPRATRPGRFYPTAVPNGRDVDHNACDAAREGAPLSDR